MDFSSFSSPRSRQPSLPRPEEDDGHALQPELRSGSVRAFSHLPEPAAPATPSAGVSAAGSSMDAAVQRQERVKRMTDMLGFPGSDSGKSVQPGNGAGATPGRPTIIPGVRQQENEPWRPQLDGALDGSGRDYIPGGQRPEKKPWRPQGPGEALDGSGRDLIPPGTRPWKVPPKPVLPETPAPTGSDADELQKQVQKQVQEMLEKSGLLGKRRRRGQSHVSPFIPMPNPPPRKKKGGRGPGKPKIPTGEHVYVPPPVQPDEDGWRPHKPSGEHNYDPGMDWEAQAREERNRPKLLPMQPPSRWGTEHDNPRSRDDDAPDVDPRFRRIGSHWRHIKKYLSTDTAEDPTLR